MGGRLREEGRKRKEGMNKGRKEGRNLEMWHKNDYCNLLGLSPQANHIKVRFGELFALYNLCPLPYIMHMEPHHSISQLLNLGIVIISSQ